MKIAQTYSHLNGLEFLQVHHRSLLGEIRKTLVSVNAKKFRTKVSKEKTKRGRILYSPVALNDAFAESFNELGWKQRRVSYWVTEDVELIRKTLTLPADVQRAEIEQAGKVPLYTYNQTDFVKSRVAVEVQFGKYSFVAYDLFVKHMAFYVSNEIDVGVEILPMKVLANEMSSGVPYYENELYNVIRQGRGVPAVPLVILGVEP